MLNLRLGMAGVDPEYFELIKSCLRQPQCVGILGGKPNFALYFVGFQGDELIFLDPHYVQDSLAHLRYVNITELAETYRSRKPKKIQLSALDPCIGIGFLLKNGEDLRDLESAFTEGPLRSLASFKQEQQQLSGVMKDLLKSSLSNF